MKNRLSSASILGSLLTGALIALAGCSSSSSDATLTVVNQETVSITDLYVNAVGNDNFTDNLLGNVPLAPGQSIIIDVACDHYDVDIIDEANGHCTILNTDLCFNDAQWVIDDAFCTFSARKADGTMSTVKVPRTLPTTSVAK